MHSGNAAAMPLVRNAATLSFCHASRSVRITTAILVSNCMMAPVRTSHSGMVKDQTSDVQLHIGKSHLIRSRFRVRCFASPGMTNSLPPGVAGPGADHALLAAEFVAFA